MHDIKDFKRGTQILYVPNHANGDLKHPDVLEGFVTSVKEHTNTVYCRYWHGPDVDPTRLRTTRNSEGCDPVWLVIKDTRPQAVIDKAMAEVVEPSEQFFPGTNWGQE